MVYCVADGENPGSVDAGAGCSLSDRVNFDVVDAVWKSEQCGMEI